jgi:transposase
LFSWKENTVAASIPEYTLFVGIDIAAKSFTALIHTTTLVSTERPFTLDQTPHGFAALQQRLAATTHAPAQTLIVLEATSTYWTALALTLHQAGYAVSVVNPEQVHHYAKSLPRRGKTDNLDAFVLARYAAERKPTPWTPPPAVYHEVRQRLVARDALVAMRQQARNHRHALLQWPVVVEAVKTQLDEVIADLDARIATLDAELATVLADGAWAQSAALLQTIPGIAILTTAWLLVATINFTISATPMGLAAYAGLVPLPRDSGSSVRGRPRIGHGGHGRLRAALYLATLSAARHNPAIKPFYDRLRAAGKPMKVARCAAARKLLHIAWAVVTKEQPFRVI